MRGKLGGGGKFAQFAQQRSISKRRDQKLAVAVRVLQNT